MAFVFRDERKSFFPKSNAEVGPGTYEAEPEVEPNTSIPKAYVPFGVMEARLKDSKFKEPTPGPGTYQISKPNNGQKVVVSSATEDIKILEVAKPSSNFKSTTKRFVENKPVEATPGPGQYNHNASQIGKRATRFQAEELSGTSSSKPKIIEHLIKINKYQSIPSIPSNIHAFGYNENQRNQLELNQPPIEIIKGEKGDLVGPGHYNVGMNLTDRKRGLSWQHSRIPRTLQSKPTVTGVNVGPGTYQPKPYVPPVSFKPSSEFVSKSVRPTDIQGARRATNVSSSSNYNNNRESRVLSEKAPESTHVGDDSSSDEYEFVDDSTPGPGSYLQISQTRSTRTQKSQHFGSTSRRFPELQSAARNLLGPGEYAPPVLGVTKPAAFRKNIKAPFGANHQRFQAPSAAQVVVPVPGPGAYEPRNTLQDRLIFKIQRGYRGQFGSTQQRFKEYAETDYKLGPGMYNTSYQPNQEPIESSVFKSKTNKGVAVGAKKELNPPPGAYNLNYFDLSKNVIKEEEEDPELVIKKPGFGTGAERFKYVQKKEDPFDDDDIIHQIQTKAQLEQKQRKNPVPFNSKQPRMPTKLKDVPGPGTYQGSEDAWNKRTFNILFADI